MSGVTVLSIRSGSFRSEKGKTNTAVWAKNFNPFSIDAELCERQLFFTKEIIRYSVRRPSARVLCYFADFLFIYSSNGVAYFRFFFLTFLLTLQPKIELLLHNFRGVDIVHSFLIFYTYDL